MRLIHLRLLVVIMLTAVAGCSAVGSYQAPGYIPPDWLTDAHIEDLMARHARPAPIGQFESSKQYRNRVDDARSALAGPFEVPVRGELAAGYDADAERIVLPIENSRGLWWDWQTRNGVSIFDGGARYPEITIPLSRDVADAVFEAGHYGMVLVGSLRDFTGDYLPMRPAVVLIYDTSSRRVLASAAVD